MKNNQRQRVITLSFISIALIGLVGAALIGCLAAFQFLFPDVFRDLGFVKTRPIHVSLAVAWIFLSAVGGIYHYLSRNGKMQWFSLRWPIWQLVLILVTGTGILICYMNGIFGGREYWEHPVWFAIPIIISWLLLVVNFFKTIFKSTEPWPVYYWMWSTGILFFLLTFIESNLWVFPFFRNHLIRDLTVQWKSYGALVGSWNMLVYGTAAYLADQFNSNTSTSRSRTAFLLYILGFTNLLFGWAHHIYTVPSAAWIRNTSYVISMSELLILFKLIWNIRSNLRTSTSSWHILSARFLFAADIWVFLNLILALLISIPAVNLFTHGTHITVAHAMGSAIGINSLVLLSSCIFICSDQPNEVISSTGQRSIKFGLVVLNISLLLFWVSLIWAGVEKSFQMIHLHKSFSEAMLTIHYQLLAFAISGLGILIACCCIVVPLLSISFRIFIKHIKDKS